MSVQHRILVVEDDPEVLEMLRLYLGDRGYEVEGVNTGEDALARSLEDLPHLIIMDITLPDIDGFEVCSRLRSQPRTAHLPIIFLTKRSKRSERLTGLGLGADDYITKPFDLEELHLRIRNLIARVERENLTDPLTGLPGDKISRAQMERAVSDSRRAILHLFLDHAEPFREVYGPLAYGDVRLYLARLILNAVNVVGQPIDYIGCLEQERFAVICTPGAARAIGEQVTGAFNLSASKHYTEADRRRGFLEFDSVRAPLMRLTYQVFVGEEKPNALQY
ncbi:MAG: response regulator transcription factor [Anaerolineae bacterium]|nr:response regulator transcription factor [Anaerolineae bacterium]